MLPIYEAIEVIEVISENVGHNKPWVVLANTPQGLTSFIVKLYSPVQVDRFHCVSKEVICNLLAREFELKVPPCALIEIPEYLSLKLSTAAQQQYDDADPRPKFATVKIDNVNNAIRELPKQYFRKRIPMDTLYAFDNLIRNNDRGHPKTNLLLSPHDAILIDHEFALGNQDIENIDLNTLQLEDKFTKYHLFYPYLKRAMKKDKQNFFNDFTEYLRMLNINRLNPYFDQLKAEGFDDYSRPIAKWLDHVKGNNRIFVTKLKGSVQ
jgi:hypothetical protein